MRKYNVSVNGTAYEVIVEEVTGTVPAAASTPAPAAPVSAAPAPAAPAPVAPAPVEPVPATGAGEPINSPMPGTILKVNATAGQTVKSGDILMILEAMKMENEIMAPRDGTITSVAISEGATVESGTLLCTIS